MIGYVLNLERLDENNVVVSTTPLYASLSHQKIYKKLRDIADGWARDIVEYEWDDIELIDYDTQVVIDGDRDDDCGTVKSRYIIESIEIL